MDVLTVWKRDRAGRVIGVTCPHCHHKIELRGGFVRQLEDGHEFVTHCTEDLCRRRFRVGLEALGGYLWEPAK